MASKVYYLMFPGQGSQYVGMCRKVLSNPAVRRLFDKAAEVLKYDLLKICLNGPERELEATIHCQPAVVVASLAAIEQLKTDKPHVLEQCTGCAGLSVGEFTALIFTGSLSLEEGLNLVKTRAEAMHSAGMTEPGSMASVIGMSHSEVSQLCRKIETETGLTLGIGNHLYDTGFVVSGDRSAVEHLQLETSPFQPKITKLPVSGAFHSVLMKPARSVLAQALSSCTVSRPDRTVYSNVTATPYTDSESIRTLLAQQLTSPVLWSKCVENIIADNPDVNFLECGPGRQLNAVLTRINRSYCKKAANEEV